MAHTWSDKGSQAEISKQKSLLFIKKVMLTQKKDFFQQKVLFLKKTFSAKQQTVSYKILISMSNACHLDFHLR